MTRISSKKQTASRVKKVSSKRKINKKSTLRITKIQKRDRSIAPFDLSRISRAVYKAMVAAHEGVRGDAEVVAQKVLKKLEVCAEKDKNFIPFVEGVQDMVEETFMENDFPHSAKAYILYRDTRSKVRGTKGAIPQKVKELVEESKKYFENPLSEHVYYTTYAKWINEEKRRETWIETVDRYVEFMKENLGNKLKKSEYEEIREYILNMRALGSMRLLWSSGKAARNNHITAYNCSFIAPTSWRDLAEIMYISMSGTGVGFSVEHQNVERLPMIQKQKKAKVSIHTIGDSKEGWAEALVLGLETWSSGHDITFDYSHVRPTGSRLMTMGGRSSGPGPLKQLLDFTRERMLARQNRRLTTLDVHDIVCKIGDVIVAGGVRRSALISLSDLDDVLMREAKNGQFWLNNPQRAMANNSAVYNERPTVKEFLDEWQNLVKSGSGERGIFNRGSLKKQLPVRRWKKFEKDLDNCGTNPCGEIVLKSKQFCNLSEVVCRAEDTEDTLMDKVRIATILGTYQASLTKFPFLSKEWKENCIEEALLGVSLTGQWDCTAVRNPLTLRKLKEVAIETNRKYAARFKINPSTCITCVKPSGNGSQLFNSSSGMHPRHAKYYIRRVRIEAHNPIFAMLKDMGVPYHPEVGQNKETASTFVLEFPVEAPEAAKFFKDDVSAFDQLEHWKMVKENYTEHNPSTTISVGEEEWLEVGNWVYKNWEMVGGLSFLPRSEHVYKLAPYEEITKEKYEELMKDFPEIDFAKIVLYEEDDTTQGAKELACSAGTCEVDFISLEEGVKK
ncbi:MAG: ATP cone domain-containing protein [Candidatus Paceibacterota bacterium]